MYTNDKGTGINFIDLFVKVIFAAVFIFILVWLFPKVPNMTPFYSNVFRENIKYMQEAGESYFTTEKLPQTVGDSREITLAEMFEKKLILPFVDKDGNSCNQYSSNVRVTKEENQYSLKITLICNEEQDHIVKVLGCYDYCDSKVKGQECNQETITEYQYKKPAKKTTTTYSCPSGYSRKGTYCYKNIVNSKINATKEYHKDQTVITDASKKQGSSNNEYVNPIVTEGGTSYTCPSGYTSSGSGSTMQCYKTSNATSSYSCTSGSLVGNICRLTTSISTSYSCPSGFTQSGSTCYKIVQGGTQTTPAYCPSGYTQSGSTCYKTTSGGTSTTYANATRSCSVQEFTSGRSSTSTTTYELIDKYSKYVCPSYSNCPGTITVYRYNVCSLSCTSGTLQSDGRCKITTTTGSTTTYANLTCPSGYSLSGSTCYYTSSSYQYADPYISYSCPSGYYQSGTSCYKDSSAQTKYTCATGYTLSGSTCYYYTNNNKVTGETVYNCPSGYTKSGNGSSTKCYKTVYGPDTYYCKESNAELKGTKCYKYVSGAFKGYKCPSGYTLDGKYCYKTSTDKVKATSKTSTKTVYSYKWSTAESLSGWTRTGKTRNKSVGTNASASCSCECNC